jgi:hypothetical protein
MAQSHAPEHAIQRASSFSESFEGGKVTRNSFAVGASAPETSNS